MSDIWSKNGGLYLGLAVETHDPNDRPRNSVLDEPWNLRGPRNGVWDRSYTGDGHILTLGPPGSGKTRRLLLPNLLRLDQWSIVVVDPKGNLAVQTARYRKEAAKNNVITLDPFGVIPERHPGLMDQMPYLKSAGLNPLAALKPDSDEFPDDAKAMAEAIIPVEGKEPYFSKSAQALVAGLIMALVAGSGNKASLADLRGNKGSLLSLDASTLGKVLKKRGPDDPPGLVDLFGTQYPAISGKLSRFANISPDNRSQIDILATAQTNTEWLDSPPIQRDLSKGLHDFGAMKTTPTTVYLILPPRYLETHATWLRMAITAILMPLIRNTGTDADVPVLFMLDEFAQLGRMEVIERNMALTREYGVKLWPVLQDIPQLQSLYDKRWQSFIGTAGVTQAFAPQDAETKEYLSKLSGQRDYWYQTGGTSTSQSSGNQSQGISNSASTNLTKSQGPELWDKGLGRMKKGQSVHFEDDGFFYRSFMPDPGPPREEDAQITKLMQTTRDKLARYNPLSGSAPPAFKSILGEKKWF